MKTRMLFFCWMTHMFIPALKALDNSALLKVGTQAPAFTLTSIEGKNLSSV